MVRRRRSEEEGERKVEGRDGEEDEVVEGTRPVIKAEKVISVSYTHLTLPTKRIV